MDDLRVANPTESSRWLSEGDEPAFRALLQARYGDSYSYPFLYEPGGASRLWSAGRLISLGQFDARGTLLSHTGLWVTPGRDSVDSGLSLSRPSRRVAGDRAEHAHAWEYVLDRLKNHVGFLHQNTSTLHLMAQRYASRFMRAVPVGLVVDYTRGERLIGVEGSGVPMQALAMTTLLGGPLERTRYLPSGAWGDWLLSILAGLGLSDTAVQVPMERGHGGTERYVLRPLDWNESLQLERRLFVGRGGGEPGLKSSRARVDLVHLPMGEAGLVSEGTSALLAAGYRPTGIRLRHHEPDEIVFQHIADAQVACAAVGQARLAGQDAQLLFSGWSDRCARTS
ncbi:hypothetical protein [Hyalangium rubrum]|uniref:Uncharacterized protein n=1 Tax=Hyalangium rubrum TaxID=3103134 RepID=A0ABU5GUR1_9BACT|nr:hypothetical protein [Hyalangium sp. s54d21]MDY7224929.1 hypothetical protein [Hyalangium sp. s54d21]